MRLAPPVAALPLDGEDDLEVRDRHGELSEREVGKAKAGRSRAFHLARKARGADGMLARAALLVFGKRDSDVALFREVAPLSQQGRGAEVLRLFV